MGVLAFLEVVDGTGQILYLKDIPRDFALIIAPLLLYLLAGQSRDLIETVDELIAMLVALVIGETLGPKLLLVEILLRFDEGEGGIEGIAHGGGLLPEELLVDHEHLQALDGQLVLPVLLQDAVDVLKRRALQVLREELPPLSSLLDPLSQVEQLLRVLVDLGGLFALLQLRFKHEGPLLLLVQIGSHLLHLLTDPL
jgi:hypothetical protein